MWRESTGSISGPRALPYFIVHLATFFISLHYSESAGFHAALATFVAFGMGIKVIGKHAGFDLAISIFLVYVMCLQLV